MYGRSALGSVLPLVGLAAVPEEIPGISLAKAFQAMAGAGFLLYLLIVFGLVVARFRVRVGSTPAARRARKQGGQSGWDRATVERP
jgi:hypothetical protein